MAARGILATSPKTMSQIFSQIPLTIRRGVTFGPITIICRDALGAAIPLAGWSAYAEARKTPDGPVVLDLVPVIAADDALGIITIPAIAHTATTSLSDSLLGFDLILGTPIGTRIDSGVAGTIHISTPYTQHAP